MPSDNKQLKDVQQILDIAERYGLEELSVSEGEFSVSVKTASEVLAAQDPVQTTTAPVRKKAPVASKPAAKTAKPAPDSRLPVISPMTGVFYRSASPDVPAFVEVGDVITPGMTIGLIEAMKVFSEVPSEVGGKVVEIVAANGKLVQSDDVLVYLEKVEG